MTTDETRPVAIVTGAGRGIGRAIAAALVDDGYRPVVVDLDGEAAEGTARRLGERGAHDPLAFQADVRSFERARVVIGEVLAQFGRVDALVNNAGISQPKAFVELTEDDWDRTIDVHLKGSFNWSHAVAPGMLARGAGRIVCISSVNAKTGGAFPAVSKTAYAAAKAGMLGLVRGLARELAPGVTVNAVCPGLIATELTQSMWAGPRGAEAIAAIPAGRVGQPEDIADVVAFLLSPKASYITGEVVDVNGGFYVD